MGLENDNSSEIDIGFFDQLNWLEYDGDFQTITKSHPPQRLIIAWAPSERGIQAYRECYVESLKKLLNALKPLSADLEQIVQVSSASTVGGESGELVSDHNAPPPHSERAQILLEAENTLAEFGIKNKIKTCHLRLSGLYGPGRLPGLRRLNAQQPIAEDPAGWLNLIHMDDAASACCSAFHSGTEGPFLVSSEAVVRGDFYEAIANQHKAPSPQWGRKDSSTTSNGPSPGTPSRSKRLRPSNRKRTLPKAMRLEPTISLGSGLDEKQRRFSVMSKNTPRVLLTGGSGFLGWSFLGQHRPWKWIAPVRSAKAMGHIQGQLIPWSSYEQEAMANLLKEHQPQAVVNCAAIADPASCDKDPELSERINILLPEQLARHCAKANIPFIHFSTDLVFDGQNPPTTKSLKHHPSPFTVVKRLNPNDVFSKPILRPPSSGSPCSLVNLETTPEMVLLNSRTTGVRARALDCSVMNTEPQLEHGVWQNFYVASSNNIFLTPPLLFPEGSCTAVADVYPAGKWAKPSLRSLICPTNTLLPPSGATLAWTTPDPRTQPSRAPSPPPWAFAMVIS